MAEFNDRLNFDTALSLERAEVITNEESGLLEDGQIQLVWEVPYGVAEEAKDAEKANRETLEDFNVGTKTFSGVYRSVSVNIARSGKNARIIHTLAVGYHQVIDQSLARPRRGYDDPLSDKYLILDFHNIDPAYFDSITSTLMDSTYNGLRSLRVDRALKEDGSGLITWHVGTPEYAVETFRNYDTDYLTTQSDYFNVPKELVPDRIAAAKVKGGSAQVRYSAEGDVAGTADISTYVKTLDEISYTGDIATQWSCSVKEYTDYYFRVEDPESINLSEPPQGWTYAKSVRNNEDGTFDVIVRRIQTQYRTPLTDQAVQTTAASTTTETQQLGRTNQALASISQEDGKVKRQVVRVKDDCSQDVVTTVESFVDQDGYSGADSKTQTTNTTTHTQNDPINSVTRDGNTIKVVSSVPTETGKYRTSEEVRTPHGAQATAVYGGPLQTSTTVSQDNQSAQPDSVGTVGTVVNATSTQNDFGLYDNRVETRVATDRAEDINTGGTVLVSEEVQLKRNVSKETFEGAIPNPATDNSSVSASASINEYGLLDGSIRKRTPVSDTTTSTVTNPLYSEEIRIGRNEDNAPVCSQSIGAIGNLTDSLNEFGLHDTTKRVRTATGKNAFFNDGSPLFSKENETLVNQTSPQNPGAASTGKTNEASNTINEYGLYDCRRTVTTANKKDYEIVTGGSKFITEKTHTLRNQTKDDFAAAVPSVIPENTTITGSFSINEYGLVDGTIKKRETKDYEGVTGNAGGTCQHEDTLELNRNVSSFDVDPGADGERVSVSASLNEFGNIDYSVRTESYIPTEKASIETATNKFYDESTVIKKNQDSIDELEQQDGHVKRTSARVNDVCKFDVEYIDRVAVAHDTEITAGGGPQESITINDLRNQESVSVDPGGNGEVKSVSASLNEYGRIDARVITTSATADETSGDVGGNAFYDTSVTIKRNQDSVNEPTKDGKVVTVDAGLNRFGKIDYTKTERTPTNVETLHTSTFNEFSRINTTNVRNADELPGAETDGVRNQVIEGTKNAFGLYDYVKRETTPQHPDSFSYTKWGRIYYDYSFEVGSGKRVAWFKNREGFIHNVTFHSSITAAYAAIDGGEIPPTGYTVDGHQSSTVRQVAPRVWMSDRVTRIATTLLQGSYT